MVGEHPHDPATEWWMREHSLRLDVRATLDEIKDANALSHTVRIGTVASSGSLEPVVHALQVELGDSVHAQHWPAVVESEKTGRATHLLELFSPGVDKWTMLQEVIAKRAIGPHNVVAIGDGLNDIGMVSGAGFGIAMGQGDGRLHAVADLIVGCNASGGLADAIDAVLSGDLVRSVNCND
jgi:hydroxymethylpyrimidine pyrophosphatase-like HAD family hydrolase